MTEADDFDSLDFTQPNSIPERAPSPEQTKTPSVTLAPEPLPVSVPAPAVVAEAARANDPFQGQATIPAPLSEAAELHANGNDLAASRSLDAAIRNPATLGEFVATAWLCLFELLALLGRRSAFDQLASAYTNRFGQSPPAWETAPAAPASDITLTTRGDEQIAFIDTLTGAIRDPLEKLMLLAQGNSALRLEMSKLTAANNDGCALLRRALMALKQAGKECAVGAPEVLAGMLAGKVEMGRRDDEAVWLMLLDLYQLMGDQNTFEDTAVNYAITFEVSPPSWDPQAISRHTESRLETSPDLNTGAGRPFALRGQLVAASAADFAGIDALAEANGTIEIDASALVRIDQASAGQLRAKLESLKQSGRSIELKNLTPLTHIFLIVHDFASVAKLIARQR